jgi:hypothetical protein
MLKDRLQELARARADKTRVGKTETQKNIDYHGHGVDRKMYGNTFGDRKKADKKHDPDNSELANWLLDPTHEKRVRATKDSINAAGRKINSKVGLVDKSDEKRKALRALLKTMTKEKE